MNRDTRDPGDGQHPVGGQPYGTDNRYPPRRDVPAVPGQRRITLGVRPNRRAFLKAALAGSAVTAAAVGGGVGISALVEARASSITAYRPVFGADNSPGTSNASACTTNTGSDADGDSDDNGTDDDNDATNYTEQSTFVNTEAIYLWALFTNLPQANYTLTVSPGIGTTSGECDATAVFYYLGQGSSARLYELTQSAVSWDCSPTDQSDLSSPAQQRQNTTLADIVSASNPIAVSSGDDLQLQIRMKSGCSAGWTGTMTITLYQVLSNNTTKQYLQAVTPTITIQAKH